MVQLEPLAFYLQAASYSPSCWPWQNNGWWFGSPAAWSSFLLTCPRTLVPPNCRVFCPQAPPHMAPSCPNQEVGIRPVETLLAQTVEEEGRWWCWAEKSLGRGCRKRGYRTSVSGVSHECGCPSVSKGDSQVGIPEFELGYQIPMTAMSESPQRKQLYCIPCP